MKYSHLKLKVLNTRFKYALFNNVDDIKEILKQNYDENYISLFINKKEVSAILPSDMIINPIKENEDWSCIQVIGEMSFGSVQGLIAQISNTLIVRSVGICVISTFLTDLFYVKTKYLQKAIAALKEDGWSFIDNT